MLGQGVGAVAQGIGDGVDVTGRAIGSGVMTAAGGVAAAAGGAVTGSQAAFNALSDGSKRFVGALSAEFRQRFDGFKKQQAEFEASLNPATPSTIAPGSPGPAPPTPGGQAVILDIPPDLQRYYQHCIDRGMPEEHARMLVQEVLEDRMKYEHGPGAGSWQQGPHDFNGAHSYFWEAHKYNPETRTLADDFWRYHGMPEPVQGEHAIALNKHMVSTGLGEDAFKIHKQVPWSHQSRDIEALVAPFATELPTIDPKDLVFPDILNPESIEDLTVMGSYMSQLHYHPDDIMARLEEERQKFTRRLLGLEPTMSDAGQRGRDLFLSVDPGLSQ